MAYDGLGPDFRGSLVELRGFELMAISACIPS